MKKLITTIATVLTLSSCADSKIIHGVQYDSIGAFDTPPHCINYDVVAGNVVWSVLLAETIIMPIYFIGFSIQEPVSYNYNSCPPEDTGLLS